MVAIPPEIFGHLLPLFLHGAPGVVFSSVPPYSLWEHPPGIGRIPPHRTDAGAFLLAECFGCRSLTLVKDVDGLYDADPKLHPAARFIPEIGVSDLRRRNLPTLPFEPVLLDLLAPACSTGSRSSTGSILSAFGRRWTASTWARSCAAKRLDTRRHSW